MELYTRRLILRPWLLSDAESLYEQAKNPNIGPAAGWPVHSDVDNSRWIIKGVLSANETYAVCLREDNVAIGSVGLKIGVQMGCLKLPDDEAEIGCWLGEKFWGQGLIPEACRELIRHAFQDLGLRRLWYGYYDGNEKSKRVQEKCGFVYHHTEENILCELLRETRTEHFSVLDSWNPEIKP